MFFHVDQNIIDLFCIECEFVLLLCKSKYGVKHLFGWMVECGPKSFVEY